MNRFYAHTAAGEPAVRLNDRDPADPFVVVVVDFGSDWDFTSKDPRWCRRVAATWTQAAELLDQAIERKRVDADEADIPAVHAASAARGSLTALRGSRPAGCEEGGPA